MYGCKLSFKGRLPLFSLAALAATAVVAAATGDFRGALNEGAEPFTGSDLVEGNDDKTPLDVADAALKYTQGLSPEGAEDDADDDVSLEHANADRETIPIVLEDGATVGEIQQPDLDRQKRKLRGVKTLMISMMAFLYFLATSPSGGASSGEKVALTFALVGLAQFMQSLFSKNPEYQFSLALKTDEETGKRQAVLEYGGLADTKRLARPKLRKALTSVLFAIPTFFLLSGLIITLGYSVTATVALAAIVFVLAGVGAIGSGASGALLDLFKAF